MARPDLMLLRLAMDFLRPQRSAFWERGWLQPRTWRRPASAVLVWMLLFTSFRASLMSAPLAVAPAHAMPVTPMVADADISGAWKTGSGYSISLYQSGTAVQGQYLFGSTTYLISGTVAGNTFSGSMTNAANPSNTYNIPGMTISPDGNFISGMTTGWGSDIWTKQAGVIIKITPSGPSIAKPGDQISFSAQVGGNLDKSVTWTATAGTIVNGVYTAPSGYDYTSQTITATSNADPTKKATAQVSISPTGVLDISGPWKNGPGYAVSLYQNGTSIQGQYLWGSSIYLINGTVSGFTFSGSMTNAANASNTYNIPGMTISPDGKSISGTITNWGSDTWTKQAGVIIKLSPSTPTIAKAGDQLTYTAQVGGAPDKSVTWSATAGSLTNGVYTVPSGLDYTSQTITVASNADSTKKLTTQVSILPTGQFEVSGAWKDGSGYAINLYQSGTTIQGEYLWGSSRYLINGTVNGYVFSGTMTNAANASNVYPFTSPTLTISPDGKTISGTITNWGSITWTKQSGVILKLTPTAPAIAKAGDQLTYSALVGGTFDKSVTWTATAGSIVNGVYAVPSGYDYTAQTITATSNADATKKLTAQVSVLPAGQFEVSGAWKDGSGYTINLYQSGTTIQGEYLWGSNKYLISGSVNGYVFSGTLTNAANASNVYPFTSPTLTISPDGKSISGTITNWGSITWTKQSGVILKLTPNTPTIAKPGDQLTYTAQVGGNLDKSVTWSATAGNVVNGVYTVPSGFDYTAQTVRVSANADVSKQSFAQVSITPTGVLKIDGIYKDSYTATLLQNGTSIQGEYQYGSTKYTLSGTLNGYALTLSITNGTTTYGPSVLTVSPDCNTISGYLSNWGNITWTRQAGAIGLVITPSSSILRIGATQQFVGAITGISNPALAWTVVEANGGTVTQSGLYTAPAAAGTYTVKVISVTDPTKSAQASVVVRPPVVVSPATLQVNPTTSANFAATLTGFTNTAVTWSATGGTITSAGVYTAPDQAGTYTITATSVENPTYSATATVTVPFSLVVTPAGSLTLGTNRTQQFTATLTGNPNHGVTWELPDTASGSITSDGLYTAPATVPNPATGNVYHVVARSIGDPTKTSTVQIMVKPSVLVTPTVATVKPGETQLFSCTLFNIAGGVTWSASGGTISAGGLWTAPNLHGTYSVTATSIVDPTQSGTVTVTVPVVLTLDPNATSMIAISGFPFKVDAKVKGAANSNVIWQLSGITREELVCPASTAGYLSEGGGDPNAKPTMNVGFSGSVSPNTIGGCAPAGPRTFTLTAISVEDPAVSASVQVEARSVVDIAPAQVTVPAETDYTFKNVKVMGVSTGFAVNGFVFDPVGSQVVVTTTGGTTAWLDASHVGTGVGGGVGIMRSQASGTIDTGGSVAIVSMPVYDDLKYTAPVDAGTYYLSVAPKINPEAASIVKITVPFTITITGPVSYEGSVNLGSTSKFIAKVSGSANKAVDWSMSTYPQGIPVGSFSPDGVYTAPTTIPDSLNTIQIVLTARSQADPSKYSYFVFYVARKLYLTERYHGSSKAGGTIRGGTTVTLLPTVVGLPTSRVNWSCTGGTMDPDGTWHAPDVEGTYIVTATSVDDPSQTATAVYNVPFEMWVNDPYYQAQVPLGSSFGFTTTLYGSPDKSVTWSLAPGSAGSIDPVTGVFTAPTTMPAIFTGHVIATSNAKPSVTANRYYQIVQGMGLYCGSTRVEPGAVAYLTAYRNGVYTPAVTWSCTGGSINASGTGAWTAPMRAGTYTVTATMTDGSNLSASQTFTVPIVVKITSDTSGVSIRTGATYKFQAQAFGAVDPSALTWSLTWGAGTLDPDGTYHAPAVGTTNVMARAQSIEDPTAAASVQLSVALPLTVSPTTATVPAGASQPFSAKATGLSGVGLVWSASSGTIDQNGNYTAPPQAGTYTVTVTSVAEPGVSATATVTVPVSVVVTPPNTILPMGFTQGFFATVLGDPSNQVTWSVSGASLGDIAGTINQFGAYTPPNKPGTYTVKATSVLDPTKSGTATVKVPQPLVVSPERVTLKPSATRQFSAVGTTALGTPTVTWTASAGSIAADGTYAAPATPGTYTVTATSTTDATVFAVAEVRVTLQGAVEVSLTPEEVQLKKGGSTTFTATVNGAANPGLTWSTTGGSVDATGTYTAPAQFGTFYVYAQSVEDPTVRAMATIVVSAQAGTDQSFTYDDNGNLLNDGVRSFEWDVENRLISVTKGTHRSEFEYDPLGRRSRIIEKDQDGQGVWSISSDKRYLWEGSAIVEEESANGSTLKAFYGQGFVDTDGTALFYTEDHLGSVRELVDMSGVVRARYDYDPYGRMTKVMGDRDSLFLYTGMLWHKQSGLNFAFFRAYDPNLGRWISRDPLQERGGMNFYAYANNSPVRFIDPSGLSGYDVTQEGWWQSLESTGTSIFGFYHDVFTGNVQKNAALRYAQGPLGQAERLTNPCSDSWLERNAYRLVVGSLIVSGAAALGAGGLMAAQALVVTEEVMVTEETLLAIEEHLATVEGGGDPENLMMLDRLRMALQSGESLTGADLNFFEHELLEAARVAEGIPQEIAHWAAIFEAGVSPFALYAPEVIMATGGAEAWNIGYLAFWGLVP
jgi:RHS repeat-associated protein